MFLNQSNRSNLSFSKVIKYMLMASLLTVVVSVGVTVDMSFRIDEINNSKATQNRNISLNQQKTTDYKFNLSAKGLGFIEAHNDKGNFKK